MAGGSVLADEPALSLGNAEGASILDKALEMIGKSRQDFDHSDMTNLRYLTVGRYFPVNDVIKNPFYLPLFGQTYGAKLCGINGTVSPRDVFLTALQMSGGSLDKFAEPRTFQRSLLEVFEDMQIRFNRTQMTPGTKRYLDRQIQALPDGLEEPLVILCEALMEAATLRKEAVEKLTTEERHLIVDNPLIYFCSEQNSNLTHVENPPIQKQLEVFRVMQKIDLPKLFMGMKMMAEAVEVTRPKLQWVHKRNIAVLNDDILLEFKSPIGPIIVGGPGINRYETDAALLVDLDGSDVYNNNAGGSFPIRGGVACLIDLGGNDIYSDHRVGVMGSGILGIGLLIDYHGEDHYSAGDWSLGSAFGGAGLIYDEKGSDSYQGGILTQGAAAFGIGVAVDVDGHDFLICDSFGQGFGSTMGTGILVNVYGRDNYAAGRAGAVLSSRRSGFAQGSGLGFYPDDPEKNICLWGGLGCLVDGHGNDQYFSNYYSQGAAYSLSTGILIDSEGSDLYDGRIYCQGAAENFGCGLLADQTGRDRYHAERNGIGYGGQHSSGIVVEYEGNDIYWFKETDGLGFGKPSQGLGLVIDYRGDDRFEAMGNALGSTYASKVPWGSAAGIFINHRGVDEYLAGESGIPINHENDIWLSGFGGVGIDTALAPKMYFKDERGISAIKHYQMGAIPDLQINHGDSSELGSSDTFIRFRAAGELVREGIRILPVVAQSMDIGHSEFRRLLEDVLVVLITSNSKFNLDVDALLPVLHCLDPQTRLFGLELIQRYAPSKAPKYVIQALSDNSAEVRAEAVWITGCLNIKSALETVQNIAVHDESVICRRTALESLGKMDPVNNMTVFREALRDPDQGVQWMAIDGVAAVRDVQAIGMLQLLAASDSRDLCRFAAKALVQLGDKSGIPILIDGVDILAEDNMPSSGYDNIPGILMEYTGVYFGFDKEAWIAWWSNSQMTMDLKTNIEAREHYYKIVSKIKTMSAKQILDSIQQLRFEYPDYHGYDRYLTHTVFDLVKNQYQNLGDIPETLLELACLCAEMDDSDSNVNIFCVKALLKQAKTVLARKLIKNALKKFPGNAELLHLKNKSKNEFSQLSEKK